MRYKNKRTVLIYMLVFLLVSLFGMLLEGHPLFNNFSGIFYGWIIVVWAMTVLRRIIEPQIKALLLENAVLLLLLILFQALRYQFEPEHGTVHRFMWYSYYFPVCFIPVISLKLSLRCGRSENAKTSLLWNLFFLPSIAFSILFLTNDNHQLAFSFPDPIGRGYDYYSYGIVFYLTIIWISLVLTATIVITIVRFASKPVRKDSWVYYVVLAASAYFLVFDVLGFAPVVNGVKFLSVTEIFSIFVVCGWEACIQTCLLPSNSGYMYFFENSGLIAKITDLDGSIRIASKSADFDWENVKDNYHIMERDVWGGKLSYAEDVSYITESNRQLKEISERLKEENALFEAENELKAERVQTSVMNRLYDDIAEFCADKIKEIESLLSGAGDEKTFRENLEKSCIFASYMKRRGNLYLLGEEGADYEYNDLYLSFKESLDYFSLGGSLTFLAGQQKEPIEKNIALAAYDCLELLLETLFRNTKSLLINMDSRGSLLEIRFMFESSIKNSELECTVLAAENKFGVKCSLDGSDGETRVITCSFENKVTERDNSRIPKVRRDDYAFV